jgi:iron(III) transport system substrate-binding protein
VRRRRLGGAVAALALSAAVAGCGGGDPGSGRGSITLYNGQHPQLTNELVAAFQKQTGISVQTRTEDGIVLAGQLLQEGDSSPADVYLTENSPELVTLDQHGLLARLPAATLRQVRQRDEPPSGDWAPVALRLSGLAYDPARISKSSLPASILDLAQPAWKGKVAVALTDSDFPPLVGAVIAGYGVPAARDWLAGLKRNAEIFTTDEAVVAAVNRGAVATGIINHYYWYRLRLELGVAATHSALYYFPDHNVGSVENISGAAVLASSKHRAAAGAFVRFLVGPTAQRILARSDDFEYPARPGIAPNSQLTPLPALSPARLGAVALGNDQQAARLIQEAGLV